MLNKRIAEYITWIDSDEPLDMPEWMGGSEWHADNNGISEHWDSVLLRQAQSELVQFEAENTRLREALFGEYCDCGMKNATIRIGTHTYMCTYFRVMNRILSQKVQSDEIKALEGGDE